MRLFKKIMTLLLICFPVMAAAITKQQPPVVYTEDKPVAVVTASNPVFSIKLKSNPTTGYSWYLRRYNTNVLQPVKHSFEPPENSKLLGAPGYEIWTFRVKPDGFKVPMQTKIRFVYARSWEINDQGKQLVFQVTTQ